MDLSKIPKAGVIDVADAPDITYTELMRQIVDNVSAQINFLDEEISNANSAEKATAQVKMLYEQIHEMKIRTESVAQALADINSSEEKKCNLTNKQLSRSGVTLLKTKELVKAVNELQYELKAAEFDYYRTVADLLVDVKEKLSYFKSFGAIPHISLIKEKITAIEKEIGRQVQWTFREIGPIVSSDASADPDAEQSPENSLNLKALADIYLVVDALGVQFRNDLMERFAQLQLIPYEKIFKLGNEHSALEHIGKRFVWFERLLKAADSKLADIIPDYWHLSYHLFLEFTRRTKLHLHDVLTKRAATITLDESTNVKMLLHALKFVISFENKMRGLMHIPLQYDTPTDEGTGDDVSNSDKGTNNTTGSNNAITENLTMSFSDSIADAFDSYLGPYVQLERKNLEVMMQKIADEEVTKKSSSDDKEFISSKKMFEYIKSSLKRCTAFSTGLTYVQLSKEFRICLYNYCESLKFRCPTPLSFKDGKDGKKLPVYELNASKEELLCRIVTTAIYCIDTIPPLEAMMKKHINPAHEAEIDFSVQIDSYADLINYTFQIYVSGVQERFDDSLKDMRRMNWSSIENVGDSSTYVKDITSKVGLAIPRVRSRIHHIYFNKYCMDVAAMLLQSFIDNVWKIKKVSKTGGAQLLMDLNGLDEFLMKLPNVRLAKDAEPVSIPKSYVIFINSRTSSIENILKLLCTEDDQVEGMFPMLWPDGQPSDLDKIMLLKKGNSLLPIPGPAGAVLDKVGDHIKDKLNENVVGRAAVSAVGEMKGVAVSAVGEMKGAAKSVGGGIMKGFGEMTSAVFTGGSSLFEASAVAEEPAPVAVKPKKKATSNADGKASSSSDAPKKKISPTKKKETTEKPASGMGGFSFFG